MRHGYRGVCAMRFVIPGSRRGWSRSIVAVVICLAFHIQAVADEPGKKAAITEAEVNAAQQAWCDGLVKIGKVYKEDGDYKAVASKLIDDLYDYKDGKVFFKPTLAFGKNTFRPTKE